MVARASNTDMTNTNLCISGGYADITPWPSILLAGYGIGRKSTSLSQPLEVNAILLKHGSHRVIFVQLDVVSVGARLRHDILEYFSGKICDKELVLIASHTHYAPNIDYRLASMGAVNGKYYFRVVKIVCNLLERVIKTTPRIVNMSYGEARAHHSMNRRAWCIAPIRKFPFVKRVMALHPNPLGPRDDRIRVFTASDRSHKDKHFGILWNYACHPVTSWPHNAISSDYPGVVRSLLRAQYGNDLPIVFLPGFSGNIRPNRIDRFPFSPYYLLHRAINGPVFGKFTSRQSSEWNNSLADIVLQVVSNNLKPIEVDGISSARTSVPIHLLMKGIVDDRTMTFFVIGFDPHFGFCGISAEPVIEYAYALEQYFLPRVMVSIGYIDTVCAYLPISSMLAEGGLEVSSPGFGLDEAEYRDDIFNRVIDIVQDLWKGIT